jgi:ribonucleoside-diphosphate reductase alpha subunit
MAAMQDSRGNLHVIKRSGSTEPMRFDKISDRIVELSTGLDVDAALITMLSIKGIISGMKTSEIDKLVAETAFCLSTYNPDYDVLASKLYVSNLHKLTRGSWNATVSMLMANTTNEGEHNALLDPAMVTFAQRYMSEFEKDIDYALDYTYSYFSLKILEKSYLLRDSRSGTVIERPQHMLMRVAVGIHYPRKNEYDKCTDEKAVEALERDAVKRALKTYYGLAHKHFTHATPTLFNAGTPVSQLASCFLLTMDDDLDHIYETLKRAAKISKFAGGVAINITRVRAKNSLIRSTNGLSDGIIPMIQVFDKSAKYVTQGGRRKGSIVLSLEPWHADVLEFVDLRLLDGGPVDLRCNEIFLALWMNDLFMKRLLAGEKWSLFCPNKVPALAQTYGDEFEKHYLEAEEKGLYVKQIKAEDLWMKILQSQQQTGLPYMLWKDHVNRKSNQSNIGMIACTNLCTEIMQYSDPENIAVCTIASMGLPTFCPKGEFNFDSLGKWTEVVTENLNRLLDYGHLPVEPARRANSDQRAIGIGIQGLQEVLFECRLAWDDPLVPLIDRKIAETIYYHACKKSIELAEIDGPYKFFKGSPISEGRLQCDLWDEKPITSYDWDHLRTRAKNGVRNSLLVAYMPTAATASILGNTESFECATSMIYSRKVLAGEFPVVCGHLIRDLKSRGIFSPKMVDDILRDDGSIQNIPEIPDDLKRLYRTVWEYPQRLFADLSRNRAPFIDQSQSLNIFLKHPSIKQLSSLHSHTWKIGLKTGSYYIRSMSATKAQQISMGAAITASADKGKNEHANNVEVNSGKNEVVEVKAKTRSVQCTEDVCTSCSA